MRYFITGGSGLIGRWIAYRMFVSNGERHIINEPWYNYDLVGGEDVLARDQICGAILGYKPDVVIHLAAQSGVEAARREGYDAFYLNIVGTLNVLEACLEAGVQNVVAASSNHVYGNSRHFCCIDYDDPIPQEDQALTQLDAYSAGKICADYLTRAYAHNYGLNAVAVRPTNTYGPWDPHNDHIVPSTILRLLKGEPPVLWSTGEVKKSYLYAQDCADAFITIADNCEKLKGQAVNVVGCEPISAHELALKLCWYVDGDLEPVVQGSPSDQHDEYLDGSKMKALGWEPRFSLEEGLKETIEWFRSRVPAS